MDLFNFPSDDFFNTPNLDDFFNFPKIETPKKQGEEKEEQEKKPKKKRKVYRI